MEAERYTWNDVRGEYFMHASVRLFLALCGILLLAGCFAQLTPQLLSAPYEEPVESQHQFTDDFDNPKTLGNRWQRVAGWWRIDNSQLFQTLPWKSSLPGEYQLIYVYGLASGPYESETRFCFLHEGEQAAGLLLRFQDQNNFYFLRVRHYPRWQDCVDLIQYTNGVRREDLARVDLDVKIDQWYTLRAEDRDEEIIAFLDGREIFRYRLQDRPAGTVGLAVKTARASFDHFSASLYDPAAEKTIVSRADPIDISASLLRVSSMPAVPSDHPGAEVPN